MARTVVIATGVLALSLSLALEARADPAQASFTLTRGAGAEKCPDEAALASLVETVAGSPVLSSEGRKPVHLQIDIQRAKRRGYVARVELFGDRSGTRTIEDEGPGCEPLSQALAVTIAVLLESGPAAPKEPAKVEAPRAPRADTPAAPTPPEEKPPSSSVTLTAGALYDFGTLDGSAGGIAFSAEVIIPIVSFGLSFIGLPYAATEHATTTVVYRFLAARARVCTRQPYLELFGASVCAGLLAGERRASSEALGAELDATNGAYVAAITQIEVSRRIVGPFGLYADLGITIPFYKDPIAVETAAGATIEPRDQPVAFQMGVGVRFWIGGDASTKKKE